MCTCALHTHLYYESWEVTLHVLFLFGHLNFVKRPHVLVIIKLILVMQNEAKENVDLYLPRKCSATNNIISAKDHASVQISIAEVDNEGRMTGLFKTYAFCGKIRGQGEADDALVNLCLRDGILSKNFNTYN
eukprot:gene4688-5303_t